MDERLRSAERGAAAGDPQAEAAWLRRRLAAGDLSPGRLRLAAVLGHPPARLICQRVPRVRSERFAKWLGAVRHFGGAEGDARLELAAAEAVLPLWVRVHGAEGAPHRLLELARGCLRERAAPAAQRTRRAARQALETWGEYYRSGRGRRADDVEAAWEAAAVDAARAAAYAALDVAALVERGVGPFTSAVQVALDLLGERALRGALQRLLVPWALASAADVG